MNSEKKKILVVEDEFITSADLIENLECLGYDVPASTDTGEEVFDLARKHMPDLILMDINLKGKMTGISAAEEIKKQLDIPIIFLTGQSDEATISKAIESEPFGYIIKPFEERSLKTAIMMALYKHSIDRKIKISEMKYRSISESSDALILIINPGYSIDYINRVGSRYFHMDTERIIGTFLDKLLTQEDFTKFQQKFMAAVSGQTTISEQIKLSLNGEEFWFDSAIVPIYVDNNKPDQVIWYAKDITDLIEIHHELQKKGAMQIEKNMEQFQILNDQIRNPLTVIASLASMEEGQYTDQILEHVKKIDDLVNQLDKGWVESNKIRSFFLRHYKHGEEFWT